MFKNLKLIIIIFCILLVSSTLVFADDIITTNEDELDLSSIIESSSHDTNFPNINSKSAVVIDKKSNTILYGKNEQTKRKMASTTKIMTCLIVLEHGNLNDIVQVSKKSANTGGSRLGLNTNDKIAVKDLLYGLMLCSGNDSAVALSEYISGNIENFCILMNNKAKELGLTNTNFETPHGLDSDNHYTTAYELAILANYALQNKSFAKIVSTKTYTVTINGHSKIITNTNELLGNLDGVYGVKTGFTNGANRCLVTACKRNDLDIICVVLGADTKNFRTKDSIELIEYCFKTYSSVNVQELLNKKFEAWKNNNLDKFEVKKSKSQNIDINILPLKNSYLPIEKDLIKEINFIISCKTNLEAPIYKNTKIGSIDIFAGSKKIDSTNITLNCDIYKKSFTDYFKFFLCSYNNITFY